MDTLPITDPHLRHDRIAADSGGPRDMNYCAVNQAAVAGCRGRIGFAFKIPQLEEGVVENRGGGCLFGNLFFLQYRHQTRLNVCRVA